MSHKTFLHPPWPHPSWIEIDLDQFRKNISIIRQHIGQKKFCLPIKANAYGHGLCTIGKAAEEAGVDYLAVAHLQEGIQLRQANVHIPILVLGAIHEDQIVDLMNFNLEFSISSQFKANLVAEKCQKIRQKCRVHIEVDTGMQRTGVRPETARKLFQYLKTLPCFEIVGIYSHLATAEQFENPFTQQQIESFNDLLSDPLFSQHSLIRHLASSMGMTLYPHAHLDMVRPSLITFGYLPPNPPPSLMGIAPCFSLKTRISYYKVVEEGQGISYGHSYCTTKKTRIVTIPLGYGDGYRRCLSNKGSVLIRGRRYPIVGTICMDQFMVDIGDGEAYVGDEVVLIGKQGDEDIPVLEIANLCNTIHYEVLCMFNDRIPRVYSPSFNALQIAEKTSSEVTS
jgi:alanine racemase